MRSTAAGLITVISAVAAQANEASTSTSGEAELLAQMQAASERPVGNLNLLNTGPVPNALAATMPRLMRASTPAAFELLAEAAATRHGIGIDFFKRLIQQESNYNPNAISRAGAQGIAQFMPGTAVMMGLDDPFDPGKALPKSAELLALLHRRLGNQGLAAAAYNAGEGRVRAWLSGQGGLPLETRNYVRAITGRDAYEWAAAGLAATSMPVPLTPNRAPAFTHLSGRISSEWAFALTIRPRANGSATVAAAAPPSGREHAQASLRADRRAARPANGETSLCESMRSTGCIVAAVY